MTADTAEATAGRDWATQATTYVAKFVELVQDRSVRPVLFAVQAVVVGALVGVVALFVAVAGSIGLVRLLTHDAFGGRVWISDFVIGGIFSAAGAFVYRKGSPTRSNDG